MDKPAQVKDMSSLKHNFVLNSRGVVEDGCPVSFYDGLYYAHNNNKFDVWRLYDHQGNLVESFHKTPEMSVEMLATAAAKHYTAQPESRYPAPVSETGCDLL